jgi:hypothetical protein
MATQYPVDPALAPSPGAGAVSAGSFPAALKRVSWGAIFAGAVLALALQFLFVLFGLGWGFATVDPGQQANTLSGIGTGTGIYWGITSIVSTLAGGWVAGRLAGVPRSTTGRLHGGAVWAVVTLALVYFGTSTATNVLTGAFNALGSAVGAAGNAAQAVIPENVNLPNISLENAPPALRNALERRGLTGDQIRQEAQDIYRQVVSQREQQQARQAFGNVAQDVARSPGDALADINAAVNRLIGAGGVLGEQDRQQALGVLQQRLGVAPQEAERILQSWEQRLQQTTEEAQQALTEAREEALDAATAASDALATAAFWAAIASLLGLIAGIAGGVIGRPKELPVTSASVR